jgi:lipopolysaccharide transport system permease protein
MRMSPLIGTPATPASPVLELTGESTPVARLLADLWVKRDLLVMLARKDFSARYRSSRLGLAWSVFVPLLQGTVLAIVFTRIVRVSSSYDYVVGVIAAVPLWTYFATSLSAASTALVDAGPVATRVYFPRLLVPAVPPLANLPAATVAFLVAVGVLLLRGDPIGATLLLAPAALLLAALLTVGFGAVAALLHVYFRDVRYLVQAGLLVWFYGTPVFYPLELAPRTMRPFLLANPMTGVMQLLRMTLFGRATYLGWALGSAALWTVVLCAVALAAYCRHDRIAVDRL